MQPSIIYYPDIPTRELISTPKSLGLEYEDISLTTQDQVKLHGWYIPVKNPQATLLLLHGNAGNISHRLDSIRIFNNLNLDILVFDYRGYGKSYGKVTEAGTYLDAEAAWDYLTKFKKISPDKIIIFGRSLGGSIAAWLASQHQPAALIIESSFSSVISMGKRLYPYLPVELLSRFNYDTAKYVSMVNSPVMIIHSRNDEIIPYGEGLKIYDSVKTDKQLLTINGSHNSGFLSSVDDYVNNLKLFISHQIQ